MSSFSVGLFGFIPADRPETYTNEQANTQVYKNCLVNKRFYLRSKIGVNLSTSCRKLMIRAVLSVIYSCVPSQKVLLTIGTIGWFIKSENKLEIW